MSHLRQNAHKPTGLEVYNDAAKILEELLEKHLERNLQVPRKVRRNKTDPNSETVVTNLSGSENALMRIKIKPHRHTKSLDEGLSKKDLKYLVGKTSQRKTKDHKLGGSESSIDTDDEQGHGLGKQKKKNLLKRAKERILQTFRRDQKEPSSKTTNRSSDSTSSRKHSLKNKRVGESTNEVHSQRKAYVEKDKSTEHRDERTVDSIGQSAEHSARKGAFIASFKRTKNSSSTGESVSGQNDMQARTFGSRKGSDGRVQYRYYSRASKKYTTEEGQPSTSQISGTTDSIHPEQSFQNAVEKGTIIEMPSSVLKPELNSSILPAPAQSAAYHHEEYSKDQTIDVPSLYPWSIPIFVSDDRSASQSHVRSPSPSSQRLKVATVAESGDVTRATSDSSSGLLKPENISDGPGVRVLYRAHSNLLDSPGEDIEFMDIDNSVITARKSSSGSRDLVSGVHITDAHFPDSEELCRRSHLPPGGAHSGDPEIVQPVILAQGPDDNGVTTSADPVVHTVVASDSLQESLLGEPSAHTVQTSTDREALYGKIAQKLIEMGDFYSTSASDQEVGEAAAMQPSTLTDLESEIITCLRAGGDRHSRQLDESLEEVTQQTVQEAYQRFQSTVTNSMGSDLSWHHVAFLFYTTKGVVSAVGHGSRTAKRVKEFTLQYITDTFASWIINQGGFDSVLSSEDSDFDID